MIRHLALLAITFGCGGTGNNNKSATSGGSGCIPPYYSCLVKDPLNAGGGYSKVTCLAYNYGNTQASESAKEQCKLTSIDQPGQVRMLVDQCPDGFVGGCQVAYNSSTVQSCNTIYYYPDDTTTPPTLATVEQTCTGPGATVIAP